jgi:transglutaminase-like putative cysteine protease
VSRLRVVHRTSFTYERPVSASYNELRMRPATLPGQTVLSSLVTIEPMTWSTEYQDYWGTQVTAFEVLAPHTSLVITADSRVDVTPTPQPGDGCRWEDLAGRALRDRFTEYLVPTSVTEPAAELVELSRSAARGLEPSGAAHAVCEAVCSEIEYVPGATGVHTRAHEAWAERKGVCQDIAHLALGALRAVGIPARYVSGYLHPFSDAPVTGETASGQSHAWVEWWTGDWHGYDPTNVIPAGEHHVIVGRGREYGDVAPLRGVFAGGASAEQRVEVEITQEA